MKEIGSLVHEGRSPQGRWQRAEGAFVCSKPLPYLCRAVLGRDA